MKNYLFPHIFQPIGWIMFSLSLIVGVLILFEVLSFIGVVETVINDLVIIGIVLGSLFVVCSKEKVEDEMTKSIRLSSMLNSIYAYVILFIVGTLIFYSVDFLLFAVLNFALLPILFVFFFRWEMHRYYKMSEDEEQD